MSIRRKCDWRDNPISNKLTPPYGYSQESIMDSTRRRHPSVLPRDFYGKPKAYRRPTAVDYDDYYAYRQPPATYVPLPRVRQPPDPRIREELHSIHVEFHSIRVEFHSIRQSFKSLVQNLQAEQSNSASNFSAPDLMTDMDVGDASTVTDDDELVNADTSKETNSPAHINLDDALVWKQAAEEQNLEKDKDESDVNFEKFVDDADACVENEAVKMKRCQELTLVSNIGIAAVSNHHFIQFCYKSPSQEITPKWASSHAITHLAALIFENQYLFAARSTKRMVRWKKEIDWLLSPIVLLVFDPGGCSCFVVSTLRTRWISTVGELIRVSRILGIK